MDQCDSKDRPCKIYVGQRPIFHGPLILPYIIVRLKLFLYIKKWHQLGVFIPLRALALVFCKHPTFSILSERSYALNIQKVLGLTTLKIEILSFTSKLINIILLSENITFIMPSTIVFGLSIRAWVTLFHACCNF